MLNGDLSARDLFKKYPPRALCAQGYGNVSETPIKYLTLECDAVCSQIHNNYNNY